MSSHALAQTAALGAMGLALAVALADRPRESAAASSTWPSAIEAGLDHIRPAELAARLLADPGSVALVDVRPAEEYAAFHLPGASNLDLPELVGERGRVLLDARAGRTVVLYSNGMTHPAQAWVELARGGHADVLVLEDGLDGFVRDVLTPPALRPAMTEDRAEQERPAFLAALAAFLPRAAQIESSEPAAAAVQQAPRPAEPVRPPHVELAVDPPALATPTVVSAAWVARRAPALVLLDAREKPEDYAAGHLPGARHVPIKLLRAERGGVPDELRSPEELAALFGSLGVGAETEVVAYGDAKLQDPAHLVLALIRVGHQRVAILEGGLPAWKADGHPLSSDAPAVAATAYVPRPATDLRAVTLEEVRASSTGAAARILDVRPADAFRGEVSTEARAGHIPGSLNRPYTADIASTQAGVYWRSVDELRREYEALGLARSQPVIVSCRTGHQAAQTWFTLRYVLGYEDVRWYDGSWKEWAARPELPVETGPAGT